MIEPETPLPPARRLSRSTDDRVIAGVCGGLARHFGLDPTLIRVIFGFLLLPGGAPGLVPYLILWAVTPDESGQRQSLPALCLFCWLGTMALGMGGAVLGGVMGH